MFMVLTVISRDSIKLLHRLDPLWRYLNSFYIISEIKFTFSLLNTQGEFAVQKSRRLPKLNYANRYEFNVVLRIS